MKTNKQKCLEMWEWLADNPGKGKEDYMLYLEEVGRKIEFDACWACAEAGNNCKLCPIEYPLVVDTGERNCGDPNSPWFGWVVTDEVEDSKQYAIEMVELIKETWEE